jgi:hypothetical protein
MILESAQLLSTAHRLLDGTQYIGKTPTGRNVKRWELADSRDPVLYQATHINHPSAAWARTSVENYNWLYEHFFGLMLEYTYRYGKNHKCSGDLAYMLACPPYNLKDYVWRKILKSRQIQLKTIETTTKPANPTFINGLKDRPQNGWEPKY